MTGKAYKGADHRDFRRSTSPGCGDGRAATPPARQATGSAEPTIKGRNGRRAPRTEIATVQRREARRADRKARLPRRLASVEWYMRLSALRSPGRKKKGPNPDAPRGGSEEAVRWASQVMRWRWLHPQSRCCSDDGACRPCSWQTGPELMIVVDAGQKFLAKLSRVTAGPFLAHPIAITLFPAGKSADQPAPRRRRRLDGRRGVAGRHPQAGMRQRMAGLRALRPRAARGGSAGVTPRSGSVIGMLDITRMAGEERTLLPRLAALRSASRRSLGGAAGAVQIERELGGERILAKQPHRVERKLRRALVPIAGSFFSTSAGAVMMWQPIASASITLNTSRVEAQMISTFGRGARLPRSPAA